jgi:hypothetical protein
MKNGMLKNVAGVAVIVVGAELVDEVVETEFALRPDRIAVGQAREPWTMPSNPHAEREDFSPYAARQACAWVASGSMVAGRYNETGSGPYWFAAGDRYYTTGGD